MAEYKKALKKSELVKGSGKTVEIDGNQIALFNVGDQYYAINNICIHRGGPLGEGDLAGNIVTCPWHAWEYDVTTGCAVHDASKKVNTYELKIEGEDILVKV